MGGWPSEDEPAPSMFIASVLWFDALPLVLVLLRGDVCVEEGGEYV